MTGEAVVRLARDPSPPILTPVRFQASPVLSEDNPDNAEQRQEQSIVTSGPGNLILEPRSEDSVESVVIRPVASGPVVSLRKSLRPLSEYSGVVNVSLPAAASAVSTDSWDIGPKGDADEEVANFMTVNSPVAFRPSPSRASRRSVSRQSRQSVHSVPGDPLVELMSRMVENAQQENLRREQEALRREQEMEQDATLSLRRPRDAPNI